MRSRAMARATRSGCGPRGEGASQHVGGGLLDAGGPLERPVTGVAVELLGDVDDPARSGDEVGDVQDVAGRETLRRWTGSASWLFAAPHTAPHAQPLHRGVVQHPAQRARGEQVTVDARGSRPGRRLGHRSWTRRPRPGPSLTSATITDAPASAASRARWPPTFPAPWIATRRPASVASAPSRARTTARMACTTPCAVTGDGSPDPPSRLADPRHPGGHGRDQVHVAGGRADVLGGEVTAPERVDRPAEGAEHLRWRGASGSSTNTTALPPPWSRPATAAFQVIASARRNASRIPSVSRS